jgi:hypothetical protein
MGSDQEAQAAINALNGKDLDGRAATGDRVNSILAGHHHGLLDVPNAVHHTAGQGFARTA